MGLLKKLLIPRNSGYIASFQARSDFLVSDSSDRQSGALHYYRAFLLSSSVLSSTFAVSGSGNLGLGDM